MSDIHANDRTIFLALAVLDDAIIRCSDRRLRPPEPGVRLALAVLYSAVTGPDRSRAAFDELWRTLIGANDMTKEDFRMTWAGTQFSIICRQVGMPQDIALGRALARAGGRETAASRAYQQHHPAGSARV